MEVNEQMVREILEGMKSGNKPIGQETIDEVVLQLSQRSNPPKDVQTTDQKHQVAEQEVLEIMRNTHPEWRERARAAAKIISLGIE